MKDLEERIEMITEDFIEMSKSVDRMLRIHIDMLKKDEFDNSLYGEAMFVEDKIDSYEVKIKEDSIHAIVLFQPAAGDLRALLSYIECSKMLERMGDLLKGNLDLMKDLEGKGKHLKENLYLIQEIAERVSDIFERYLDAFMKKDVKEIFSLLAMDREINSMRDSAVDKIFEVMKESPENVEGGAIILLLSKKLERLSDKIMQLGKRLVYTISGEFLRKKEVMDRD